jgi:hypothetical protein
MPVRSGSTTSSIAERAEQRRRTSTLSQRNTSGYRGVSWSAQRNKWVAYGRHNGKSVNLGGYTDIIDAAQAYDRWARAPRHLRPAQLQ